MPGVPGIPGMPSDRQVYERRKEVKQIQAYQKDLSKVQIEIGSSNIRCCFVPFERVRQLANRQLSSSAYSVNNVQL